MMHCPQMTGGKALTRSLGNKGSQEPGDCTENCRSPRSEIGLILRSGRNMVHARQEIVQLQADRRTDRRFHSLDGLGDHPGIDPAFAVDPGCLDRAVRDKASPGEAFSRVGMSQRCRQRRDSEQGCLEECHHHQFPSQGRDCPETDLPHRQLRHNQRAVINILILSRKPLVRELRNKWLEHPRRT